MSTIDRAALIERAGEAIRRNLPVSLSSRLHTDEQDVVACATLPIIAKALLAPLREWIDTLPGQFRTEAERRLDAIEAEVQP